MPAAQFLLRTDNVQRLLDERDRSHVELAASVGVTASYWSQIFRRRRPVTPAMRRALLACPFLSGVARDDLWERVESPATDDAPSPTRSASSHE